MGLNATQWRNYILTQQVGQVLALLINIIFVTRVPNVWHSRQNGCLKRKKLAVQNPNMYYYFISLYDLKVVVLFSIL